MNVFENLYLTATQICALYLDALGSRENKLTLNQAVGSPTSHDIFVTSGYAAM